MFSFSAFAPTRRSFMGLIVFLCLSAVNPQNAGAAPRVVARKHGEVLVPGFTSQVLLEAPRINAPSAIAAGPPGVLFLGEDVGNVRQITSGAGRVFRLVDRERDGTIDGTSLFVDKINGPRGLLFVDDALYVVHAPFLSVFRDADGDGRAEQRQDLITGFGPPPEELAPDHSVAGLALGVDGWLYIAVGDQGMRDARGRDGSRLTMRGGGIVRVRPDGTELELYASGTRNNYDVAVTSTMDLFIRDNTNDGGGWETRFAHMPQTSDHGYPRLFTNFADEVLATLADYGGGSGAGALWVDEPTWPRAYRQVLFTADWGRGRVYAHPLRATGASFAVAQTEFQVGVRPLDLTIDADGALFVADWGPHNYGPPEVPSGMVYRVVPRKFRPRTHRDPSRLSDAQLVAALDNPSGVLRLQAQRTLLLRKSAAALVPALEKLATSRRTVAVRVLALYTIAQIGGSDARAAVARLAGRPELREHALRAMTDRRTQMQGANVSLLEAGLRDRNPRVRAQAAISLGRLGTAASASSLLATLGDADVVVRHVGMMALRAIGAADVLVGALDDCNPAVAVGAHRTLRGMHTRTVVDAVLGKLATATDPAARRAVLDLLGRLYHDERPWKGEWWGTRPDRQGPYFDPGPWSSTPMIHKVLVAELDGGDPARQSAVLDVLARHRIGLPESQAVMARLSESAADLGAAAAAALVQARPHTAGVEGALERIVLAPKLPAQTRALAFTALAEMSRPARAKAVVRLLGALDRETNVPADVVASGARALAGLSDASALPELRRLVSQGSSRARQGFFLALLQVDTPRTQEVLATFWKEPAYHALLVDAVRKTGARSQIDVMTALAPEAAPHVRQEMLRVMGALRDHQASAVLLQLIEQDIDRAEALQALNAIGPIRFPIARLIAVTDSLVQLAQKARSSGEARMLTDLIRVAQTFATFHRHDPAQSARWLAALPTPPVIPPDQVLLFDLTYEQITAAVNKQSGDPRRGAALYRQAACHSCHTLSPSEPPRGPFLGDIAARYGRPALIESILRPNAVIAFGFQAHWFQLDDGSTAEGFLVSDKGDQYELRNAAGEITVVQKRRIVKQGESAQSVMPDGLVSRLTVKDFASLLAYLSTLKKSKGDPAKTAAGR